MNIISGFGVVAADDAARLLYGEHLLARADDPVEGALPRSARAQAPIKGKKPVPLSRAPAWQPKSVG